MSPERREDLKKRDRMEQLLDVVEEVQDKFAKFSSKVITIVLVIFIMSGVAIAGFAYTLGRLHNSRVEAAEKSCVLRNNQNEGILFVLNRFKVDDEDIISKFPIVPDCHAFAKDQTK